MIIDRRPGEPLGASLDRAVERGQLTAGDAETVELFGEWLTYAGPPPGSKRQPTEAERRWAAAFVRTERGGRLVLGTDDRGVHADYAERLERTAWTFR